MKTIKLQLKIILVFTITIVFFTSCRSGKEISKSSINKQDSTTSVVGSAVKESDIKKTKTSNTGNILNERQKRLLEADSAIMLWYEVHPDSIIAHKIDSQDYILRFKDITGGITTIDKPKYIPPVITKVFPELELFYYTNTSFMHARPNLFCTYNGSKSGLRDQTFNEVIDNTTYKDEISLNDKILAILYIIFGFESNITDVQITQAESFIGEGLPNANCRITALIDNKSKSYLSIILNEKIYVIKRENSNGYYTLANILND